MSRKKKPSHQKQPAKNTAAAPAESAGGSGSQTIPPGGGPKLALLRIAQLLFTFALIISAYLAYTSLSAGQLAGCGAGSDCSDVLTSRWAYWFKLPVSVPAVGFYLLILTASFIASPRQSVANQRRGWTVLITGAFAVLGAALWFIGLQGAIIGSWCKYCMTAHALGATGAVLLLMAAPFVIRHGGEKPSLFGVSQRAWPAVMGMLALVPLVLGQYLSTPPSMTVVKTDGPTTQVAAPNIASGAPEPESAEPTEPAEATASAEPIESVKPVEKSRMFSLFDNKYQFDLYSVPLLGNPEAPHVIVSLFDYTCSHCRSTHERLLSVQNLYSNELAIILMPMPLDSSCNPLVKQTPHDHVNACQYARIGLGVFKAKEEVFQDYENWFFETPRPRPLAEVHQKAAQLSGRADFDSVLKEPGIEAWIQLGVQVFDANYKQTKQGILPMIMVGQAVMAGEVRSDEELINVLVNNLGMERRTGGANTAAPAAH